MLTCQVSRRGDDPLAAVRPLDIHHATMPPTGKAGGIVCGWVGRQGAVVQRTPLGRESSVEPVQWRDTQVLPIDELKSPLTCL
jgi:hypothetical protein